MKVFFLGKFESVLVKLRQEAKLSMQTKMKVKKLSKKFVDEKTHVEELEKELLTTHILKDESGEPVKILDDEGNDTGQVKLVPEIAQEFHLKRQELYNTDLDLDTKFDLSELEAAESLTVEDLEVLESLINE